LYSIIFSKVFKVFENENAGYALCFIVMLPKEPRKVHHFAS
jgi:hypothetical protein